MSAEEWQAFLDRLLVKEKEQTRARDAGRRQLIVYHFTFAPDWNAGCDGCSWVADAMTHSAHLNARDTSLVMVSRAPLEKIRQYQTRLGWTIPWYSSYESDLNYDFGVTTDNGERHGASVFLRDGNDIYRTYFTGTRGVEYLGSHWTYLDMAVDVSGVDNNLLSPRNTWASKEDYDAKAAELIGQFVDNFKTFDVSDTIVEAGPKA